MYTGIIQTTGKILDVELINGIKKLKIEFPLGFCDGLLIGGSVSIDGVCLTATNISSDKLIVDFDVILKSLEVTTLVDLKCSDLVNAERSASEGAEIGGHPLSGHIDFKTKLIVKEYIEDNLRLEFELEKKWMKYVFAKGYIAINGASLTVSNLNKNTSTFEVWIIPETQKTTTISQKSVGDYLNIEIERSTQVFVDTVTEVLEERLNNLIPGIENLILTEDLDIKKIANGLNRKV